MTQLIQKHQSFNHPIFGALTVITDQDSIKFIGKEVADKLEYADPDQAIRKNCKQPSKKRIKLNQYDTVGNEMWIITESDLYRLVMRSEKEEAEKFQDWVCEDVLPSIRKTGSYNIQPQLPATYLQALEALVESEKEKQKAIEYREIAEKRTESLIHSGKSYTVTELAKELGFKSAIALNTELHKRGIQFKTNNIWMLYSKYAGKGYTQSKQFESDSGFTGYDTRWTGTGRDFLINEVFKK